MSNLASEFFYDVIRRLIPGLIVLVLYAHAEVLGLYSTLYSSLIIWGICVLLGAWLVGVIIEMPSALVSLAAHLLLKLTLWFKEHYRLGEASSWLKERLRGYSLPRGGQAVERTEKERETVRREEYKTTAEKIMLRTLAVLLLISWLWPPDPLPGLGWNSNLVCLAWVLCLLSYLWFYILPALLVEPEADKGLKPCKQHVVEVVKQLEKAQDSTSVRKPVGSIAPAKA